MSKGLLCLCRGHCPNNEANGTCTAREGSYCFALIEQVTNDNGTYEDELSYGCLPPEESGLMQCQGHLSDHDAHKNISCCNEQDFCNALLKPTYTLKRYSSTSDFNFDYNLVLAISVCFVILIAVVSFIFIFKFAKKYLRKLANSRLSAMIEEADTNYSGKFLIVKSSPSKPIDHSLTSGSGSGLPKLVQRTIANQLEMIQIINKGRYGQVWKGKWRDETIAVKVYNNEEYALWQREDEIYQRLGHENVVGFIASDIREPVGCKQLCLIMNYYKNGSLFDYLHQVTQTESTMIDLMYSATCGLCYLHTELFGKQGKPAIAHRDIKSSNIMVANDGRTCLIGDFSLAARYRSDSREIDMPTGDILGTIRYMAPEILENSDHWSVATFDAFKQADVYSFALVLWEILSQFKLNKYKKPFEDIVSDNPGWEEMRVKVSVEQQRPVIDKKWTRSSNLQPIIKIIIDSWHHLPGARLPILRIKKDLKKIGSNIKSDSLKEIHLQVNF